MSKCIEREKKKRERRKKPLTLVIAVVIVMILTAVFFLFSIPVNILIIFLYLVFFSSRLSMLTRQVNMYIPHIHLSITIIIKKNHDNLMRFLHIRRVSCFIFFFFIRNYSVLKYVWLSM